MKDELGWADDEGTRDRGCKISVERDETEGVATRGIEWCWRRRRKAGRRLARVVGGCRAGGGEAERGKRREGSGCVLFRILGWNWRCGAFCRERERAAGLVLFWKIMGWDWAYAVFFWGGGRE